VGADQQLFPSTGGGYVEQAAILRLVSLGIAQGRQSVCGGAAVTITISQV
jgi:hypothetical protein